jgi:hypothetical protein
MFGVMREVLMNEQREREKKNKEKVSRAATLNSRRCRKRKKR